MAGLEDSPCPTFADIAASRTGAFDRYDPMRKKLRESRSAKRHGGPPVEEPPEPDGGRLPKPVPQLVGPPP